MSQDEVTLEIVVEPEEYFQALVSDALKKRQLRIQAETEFYLVNLLKQFMNAENLYLKDADGNLKEEPLALMVKDALEEPAPEAKKLLFRKLGDVSLYTAGYFEESLSRRMVDVPYYVRMGCVAYQQCAFGVEKNLQQMYGELSDRFSKLVGVLSEVSVQTTPKTERNILKTCDTWLHTGSDKAERMLREAGIVIGDTMKKNFQ